MPKISGVDASTIRSGYILSHITDNAGYGLKTGQKYKVHKGSFNGTEIGCFFTSEGQVDLNNSITQDIADQLEWLQE